MRKPSEVLKLAMPQYRESNRMYMCCLIEGAYKINGQPFPVGLSRDEQRSVKDEILKRIKPFSTLMAFLSTNNPEYQRIHDGEAGEYHRFERHRFPDLHQMRVQWFENLIQELEKDGK